MIDYFSIALTHGLILFACWRLMFRGELDVEGGTRRDVARPWLQKREDDATDA